MTSSTDFVSLEYEPRAEPSSWRFSTRGIAVRLFLTCWLVYVLHFATNIVREIYPALAIGDHLSFRVDEYANMHPDLFEKPGYGWHIGNNPGASMIAAIPYALSRPIIDPIVQHVQQVRAASGQTEPPSYQSPWPMARDFYKEAWKRGYDIKFGLAAFVMQAFCMAPSTALAVVILFYVLRRIFLSDKTALWLALLYAFGTPAFFRTGYLNQNLMLGHIGFAGFITLWNPGFSDRWTPRKRYLLAGLAGGTALLFDYSGVIILLGLFAYAIFKRWNHEKADVLRHASWYVLGTLAPIGLLWFYQWQSFGNPFLPGQHWMPIIEWVRPGYRGITLPQPDLIFDLAFDYRYGLFVSSPIMLLALIAPFVDRDPLRLPKLELTFIFALFAGLWLFFSTFHGVLVQYNTGIRYMAPIFPFLFVPAAVVLVRLPRLAIYLTVVAVVTESWCLAMYRDVEQGFGLLNPVLHVLLGGFMLPALTTISRVQAYAGFFPNGASPLPLFALATVILWAVWSSKFAQRAALSNDYRVDSIR